MSHRYTRLKDGSFSIFASSVVLGMKNNPAFPNPLVPLVTLSALQSDYAQKLGARVIGGRVTTAAKIQAREILTDALRRQGNYVQGAALTLEDLPIFRLPRGRARTAPKPNWSRPEFSRL